MITSDRSRTSCHWATLGLIAVLSACKPSGVSDQDVAGNGPKNATTAGSAQTGITNPILAAAVASGTAPLPSAGSSATASDDLQAAELLARNGKTNEALIRFSELIKANPDFEEAHFSRGFFLARLGRTEEAIESYKAALRLVPDYAEAHNNVGNLLVKMKRFDEAITHFQAAIAKLPDNPSYHNNLGIALAQHEKAEEALQHFNQAVQLNAEYPDAWFNLGQTYSQMGRYPEAVRPLQMAIKLRPNLEVAKRMLKEVERRAGPRTP